MWRLVALVGGVWVVLQAMRPSSASAYGLDAAEWQEVKATAEEPQGLADGGYATADAQYVALPARLERGRYVEVLLPSTGMLGQFPWRDVGPWYIDDPYWQTGQRPMTERYDIVQRGPRKGQRSNGAGLDISFGALVALGVPRDKVASWSGVALWRFA